MISQLIPRRLRLVGWLPLLAFLLLANNARADVQPDQVPPDLKAAIEERVTAEGKQYAGLCRAVDQPANVGKYCAFVLTLTSSTAQVSYGPVLSEPVAQVNFVRVDGRWVVSGTSPVDVPSDLREAIKKHVESRGHIYAGLCTEIAQDGSNLGKYCAAVAGLTATTANVSYGPVASNDITTVGFLKGANGWAPTATSPTVPPKPPATGTGESRRDSIALETPVLLVGLLLVGVFGLLTSRRGRKESQ